MSICRKAAEGALQPGSRKRHALFQLNFNNLDWTISYVFYFTLFGIEDEGGLERTLPGLRAGCPRCVRRLRGLSPARRTGTWS